MKRKVSILIYIVVICLGISLIYRSNQDTILLGDVSNYIKGDVDGNGQVRALDYILLRNHIIGTYGLTGDNLIRADVNQDGKVSSLDYIAVKKIILSGEITNVTNKVSVTAVTLNKTNISIISGNSELLNVTISPINATNQNVIWSSSNTNVASVDSNGNVKGISEGTAEITVQTIDGNKTAKCSVSVKAIKTYDSRNKAVVAYFNDSSRTVKNIFTKYGCGSNGFKCDVPSLYNSSISGSIKVYLYNNNTKKLIKTVSDKESLNANLVPGNTYYLESSSSIGEYVRVSKVERMIYFANGLRNVRDIGGWGADGGTVKYSKIFRGINPNRSKTDKVFKELGISVIVDLRSSTEFKKASSYFKDFTKYNYAVGAYKVDGVTKSAVKKIMQSVVNGKSVYFHCAVGTDRTGTVAYLLEGILGVPKASRLDEYELSYFYRQETKNGLTRAGGSITNLSNAINKYSSSNYEQEKFINWFLAGSSNKASDLTLINNFRKAMIDGKPKVYSLSNNKLVISG